MEQDTVETDGNDDTFHTDVWEIHDYKLESLSTITVYIT